MYQVHYFCYSPEDHAHRILTNSTIDFIPRIGEKVTFTTGESLHFYLVTDVIYPLDKDNLIIDVYLTEVKAL